MDAKPLSIHVSPAPKPWVYSLHRPRVNWAFIGVWAAVIVFWGTVYWLVRK